MCAHVYDPAKDGGGKAFEDLPATWVCPVCGAPKSAYNKVMVGGDVVWAHEEEEKEDEQNVDDADKWQCKVCGHVYNATTDGGPNHLAFEDLPATWVCPVCGAPKSAYNKVMVGDDVVWVHEDEEKEEEQKTADETWKCKVCAHVYDPAKDGGGKAFEDLPATWVCPVCGAPKSAYNKVMVGGDVVWAHEEEDEEQQKAVEE